jgi:hypothetical protein
MTAGADPTRHDVRAPVDELRVMLGQLAEHAADMLAARGGES